MSWDDIMDVLFDGTQKEVDNVKCPECNGELRVSYFPESKSMEVFCKGCGAFVRESGVHEEPNFAIMKSA